jgi:hypothetical protein
VTQAQQEQARAQQAQQTSTHKAEATTNTSELKAPTRAVNPHTYAQADAYQQRRQRPVYDQPQQQHRHALATYQSLQDAAKKDELSQLMGVDLYA